MKMTFKSSYEHLLMNQVTLFLQKYKRTTWVLTITSLIISFFFFPEVINIHIGVASSLPIIQLAYYCWNIWFQSKNKTLCPKCASSMNNLACGHCGKELPPAALWLGGAFFTHCPHCEKLLSPRRHVLARCPNNDDSENADRLYSKPTEIIVMVGISPPNSETLDASYKIITQSPYVQIFYETKDDPYSSSILYFTKASDWGSDAFPLKVQILSNTWLVLISKKVDERIIDIVKGAFTLPFTTKKII